MNGQSLQYNFHFQVANGEDYGCEGCAANSVPFRVSKNGVSTTSTVAASSISTAASVTADPNQPSGSNPAEAAAQNNSHIGLALGVGLGVGIPLILLAGAGVLLWRWRLARKYAPIAPPEKQFLHKYTNNPLAPLDIEPTYAHIQESGGQEVLPELGNPKSAGLPERRELDAQPLS